MTIQINIRIILLLFGLISYKISNKVTAAKVVHDTTQGVPYSISKHAMQTNHDNVEALRSNIKDSASEIGNLFELMPTTESTESSEENKSLRSDGTHKISENKDFEKNQQQSVQELQQLTTTKKPIEQNQQEMYSIKLPNQNFHNQAMLLNGNYITHDSASFVQHPNLHLSEATKMYFGNSIPSNFGGHFEALTQNKEKPKEYSIREVHHNIPSQVKSLIGNYYNTNVQHHDTPQNHVQQNLMRNNQLPQLEPLQGINYASNIQHHDQPYNQPPHNTNTQNNDKHIQYGNTVTHYDKPQQPAHSSFFHDEKNQMPRFEALTQTNHPAPNTNTDNGYKTMKSYFNNNETDSKKLKHIPNKLAQIRHRHTLPNQAILLNHKVYHDDNYKRSDDNERYNNRSNKNHQSYRAGNYQPAHAFTFNDRTRPQIVGHGISNNNNPKKHQKRSRHHRKHGHAYNKNGFLINEHPEESQISQKNILPSTLKPEIPKQKFYINVKDDTISLKRLHDDISNKSHVDNFNRKPKNQLDSTIKHNKESHKENNDRDIIKPVLEDFHERDASPKVISNEIRHFQDIFLAHKSPHETEFGHVLETPENIEERFESNDRKNHRYKGKIQWTNKDGEFGQQFWDIGHLDRGK